MFNYNINNTHFLRILVNYPPFNNKLLRISTNSIFKKSRGNIFPHSTDNDVTPLSTNPHGFI